MEENFDFFNNFLIPVLVLDKNNKPLYKNVVFNEVFSEFSSIKKFLHKFNFDLCAFENESLEMFSPIYQAINSEQNFFARVTYQDIEHELLYFDFYCQQFENCRVLTFNDITDKINVKNLIDENRDLKENCEKLQKENDTFIKIKQKAQSQAIKMVLINKMTNIIRRSIDIDTIINSTLKELVRISGAIKSYFASIVDKTFLIEYGQGDFNQKDLKTFVKFDENTFNSIVNKEITSSVCLKEHAESCENLKTPLNRIIIPIYNFNKLMGIVVVFLPHSRNLMKEKDILESVSVQLGNAITQAYLFQQVNHQKDELQNALKELKDTQVQLINSEKMASLGQLIAGVAHEINTPIASINSNNDIFKRVIDKVQDKERKEMLEELNLTDKEAINRITNIVKSLKRFVRLDEADLQEADINKELDLTLDLIRHETKNKIEVIKNYANLPIIKCYPNMLNQVFMNILVNACQSIEKQGEITITTEYNKNNVKIKIADTGCGIEKGILDKIFLPGFTTKKIGVGTGLGLAICQKIIDKHNGKIIVKSKKNKGSEFVITIPR